METIALILGFIIVFGGIGYAVMDTIKHFDNKKTHH
jgi:Trk-type K+ transport system membrane component